MFRDSIDNPMFLKDRAILAPTLDVVKAKLVFYRCLCKDTVTWNSIISGYAQHGLGDEALQVFDEISLSGTHPDEVTFARVLSACSYSRNVEEGKEIFESMRSKHRMESITEHCACMIDLLGRAGKLDEAMRLINEMPVEAGVIIWGSLMGACRNHMNSDLAEIDAKKFFKLDPDNAGPTVLLSNIYTSEGRWENVAKLRRNMRSKKVSKLSGFSWIEVEKEVHMFLGGDRQTHREHAEIVRMWERLSGMLREGGYNPDGSFTLHDVDEEEKAQSLRCHSEKHAVEFGLLKLTEGVPIWVMKNIRVCGDCHTTIKLIAKITGQ